MFQWVDASVLTLSVCSRFRKDVPILPYMLKLRSAAHYEGDTERVRKAISRSSVWSARSTNDFQLKSGIFAKDLKMSLLLASSSRSLHSVESFANCSNNLYRAHPDHDLC